MKSRTKQTTSAVATTSTTKNSATALTCETQSSKAYPSISAAYWLPAPNATPYLLPG